MIYKHQKITLKISKVDFKKAYIFRNLIFLVINLRIINNDNKVL